MPYSNFFTNSLAGRFSLIFGLGTSLTLVLLGSGLAIMLKHQIEERDLLELNGKSEVIQHLLTEIKQPGDLTEELRRIQDVAIGHGFLQLGIFSNNRWLLRPNEAVTGYVDAQGVANIAGPNAHDVYNSQDQQWWLRHLRYQIPGDPNPTIYAVIGVNVSESRALNARFNTALGIVGLAGALLMGALSWWGTRRALAPLDTIAERAEQVTVLGLGKSLVVSDAPVEVHGLVLSINHMLGRLGESFEALEQFSSNIAHELRTPLNAMKLQTEVTLTRDRSEDEYRESLHHTLIEINRLQRMVADMLFIARADRGMYSPTLKEVCVEDDLRDTVDYFNVAASEKAQTLQLSGTLRAMCDRSMMRRAVTNLLSNAIRYAPTGAQINITLSNTDDEAIIRVNNPSQPYTPLEIERLFDRFTRNEEDKHSQTDGLGLGLAIVRSIMQLHGGSASARPTDTGIEFSLRWPLVNGGARTPESMIEFPKSA